MAALTVRDADPRRDAAACAAIYAPYVLETAISFEEEPPGEAEMGRRIAAAQRAHAWLVAERQVTVVGYAYGSQHRSRSAYHWACDVAVYVASDSRRQGAGGALYATLLERLREDGLDEETARPPRRNRSDPPMRSGMLASPPRPRPVFAKPI